MSHALRIAVADDEVDMRDYLQDTLPAMGHEVAGLAKTGRELVELCHAVTPDLVITDIKMPDMDGIDAAVQISHERPIPVILVSAYVDATLLMRAEADHILAYLIKPIKQADLEAAIGIAMRRFEQFEELRKEALSLRQALEDRKIIERAKGVLMKRVGLNEDQAFRRLQKLASDKSRKLVEIAHIVLISEEVLGPAEKA
jgi:AmiR/NasT family two-component response regulator